MGLNAHAQRRCANLPAFVAAPKGSPAAGYCPPAARGGPSPAGGGAARRRRARRGGGARGAGARRAAARRRDLLLPAGVLPANRTVRLAVTVRTAGGANASDDAAVASTLTGLDELREEGALVVPEAVRFLRRYDVRPRSRQRSHLAASSFYDSKFLHRDY